MSNSPLFDLSDLAVEDIGIQLVSELTEGHGMTELAGSSSSNCVSSSVSTYVNEEID